MTATATFATFLFRFTPSLMECEALEAIFVQREDTVNRILERIWESTQTKSKYHTLFIGPRGIGKTHLVSLIYHRTKAMEDLEERLLIAWMREEEWGITSLLDLLMRIFRALVAEYKDDDLEKQVEALYKLPPESIEKAAGKLLKEYAGNRALLVLIENLDDIFQGLGDEGQKRLCAYIQENPFLTIVATSQNLFSGVSRQKSPFYGFFSIEHLTGLSFEESVQLLTNIARYKGDEALAAFIQTSMGRARIRALNHLAGGNHRIYIIFSQFLTRESLDTLVEPFMQMLDDLTPYYQDRMRWLSTQQRKIVEFLLNHRSPAIVKDIAQRCCMSQQTASGQLKSLREMRYVQSIPAGRESYYELSEPLMQLCVEVRKNRGEPIQLLIDFLRLWYLPEELKQHLELLSPKAALEREYVRLVLQAIEEDSADIRVAACKKDLKFYYDNGDIRRCSGILKELAAISGDTPAFAFQAFFLNEPKHGEEALKSVEQMMNPDSGNRIALLAKAKAFLMVQKYEDAVIISNKLINLEPVNPTNWYVKASVLSVQERWQEALEAFNKVIEIDSNHVFAWAGRGAILTLFKRFDDAISSYNKAIELSPQREEVFYGRLLAFVYSGRWGEGLRALDKILEHFRDKNRAITGASTEFIKSIFNGSHNTSIWKARIATLLNLYDKHKIASALSGGLVSATSLLQSEMGNAKAKVWRDVWQELAGNRDEFKLPLRLLDAVVLYRESKDQRVLLKLPVEERKIIEDILKIKEKTED